MWTGVACSMYYNSLVTRERNLTQTSLRQKGEFVDSYNQNIKVKFSSGP